MESSLEKSVTEPLIKKWEIDLYFKKDCCKSLGEVVAKLVAVDSLAFNQIASSKLLRTFAVDRCSLPSSWDYVKKVLMTQFAKTQNEIVMKIPEIKGSSNCFLIQF